VGKRGGWRAIRQTVLAFIAGGAGGGLHCGGGGRRGLSGKSYRFLSQYALGREPNGTTESISQLGSRFARVYPLVASARILGDVDHVFTFSVSLSDCNARFQVVLTQSVIVSRTGTGFFSTPFSSK